MGFGAGLGVFVGALSRYDTPYILASASVMMLGLIVFLLAGIKDCVCKQL